MESIKNLSIPEIPEIPRDLLAKILREEVIVFVGNGVSMLACIPSWKDLASKYLEDWRSRGSISYDAFEKLKREKI
ncbi:MAG: hypothetical protein PHN29_06350, partial [Endomicrobiaceae bacterium]|nr:hypothetical protein [Endomicrobiaceae bacterium]